MADDFPPEYWTSRAEEARALAERMQDPGCRETMLEIAAGYDRMSKAALRLRDYGQLATEAIALSSAVKSTRP